MYILFINKTIMYTYKWMNYSTIDESSKNMDVFIEESADLLIQELKEKRKISFKEQVYV